MSAGGESGGVTGTSHGFSCNDFWAMKLHAAGAIELQQLLGGSQSDYRYEIEPTTDGGYIAIGYMWSSERGDVPGKNNGYDDIWVVWLNATGGVEWEELLGGSGEKSAAELVPAAGDGYLLANSGSSRSWNVTP